MQVYNNAMIKYYLADTVEGYRIAAEKFRYSAALDIANVKALAMLASSYLNLIDSSNKDENYFSVISKLIDMSRAKAVDLPETVIADVEFYIVVNKAEAAKNRIAEYTTLHQNFGFEMFYYIALAFHEKGDPVSAAKYLSQFPESKIFTPKIFYLKGQIAEKLKDTSAALAEYKKAIKFNPNHARSHLKIAEILSKQGSLKDSAVHLDFLITHINLLAPKEIAQTYFLHAQLSELYQKWNLALGDVERAVKLDPENHDYLLELYTLRARVGESIADARKQARMYYFLGEGEKLILQGKHQDALIPLLQARQLNDASPLPLLKMGDMFTYIHDVQNAKNNYKLAAARAPNNIQVWSKYIQALIQSFEWDEAKKAMDKFRNLPVSQSAIDKAAADMYQKQGRYAEAQGLYRKAMQRDLIDPDVYIAYAKSLMSTRNFKDAPFFFALALRFDPLNVDAIMNTAKCVAETESIDRAISMLQDELRMRSGSRAEFLSAIAELQIQKGSWEEAQKSVDEAIQLDQNYAYPWKLQAQIYMNREGQDRDALSKALFAYKSYSERNASDPSGYLERYKIFIKKTDFESSKEELKKIYEIYPKYPNLHFYFGKLYGIQGNHRAAAEEFKVELANNPDSVPTLIEYGKSLLELNFASEALKLFTKAMQLAPELADPKQNAGWTNYKLKNYQAAIALIRAALVIDKGNPAIYKRLGIVFRDMGDTSSACAAFKKYLEMEPDAPDKSELRSCL
jgi:tetratricopeptide (TPR) repeat protein